jgi:hypothetical protein
MLMQSAKQDFEVMLSLCQLFGVESKISLKYYNKNNFLSFLKVLVLFILTKSTFKNVYRFPQLLVNQKEL